MEFAFSNTPVRSSYRFQYTIAGMLRSSSKIIGLKTPMSVQTLGRIFFITAVLAVPGSLTGQAESAKPNLDRVHKPYLRNEKDSVPYIKPLYKLTTSQPPSEIKHLPKSHITIVQEEKTTPALLRSGEHDSAHLESSQALPEVQKSWKSSWISMIHNQSHDVTISGPKIRNAEKSPKASPTRFSIASSDSQQVQQQHQFYTRIKCLHIKSSLGHGSMRYFTGSQLFLVSHRL